MVSLKDRVTREVAVVFQEALASYFSRGTASGGTQRDRVRKDVLEPLNRAYAAVHTAISLKYGTCSLFSPHFKKLRESAVSEIDLEGYFDGKAIFFSPASWQGLALADAASFERLLPGVRSSTSASWESMVNGLVGDSPSTRSLDLMELGMKQIADPVNRREYAQCEGHGLPSLRRGLRALLDWNSLVDYAAGRTLPLAEGSGSAMADGSPITIYRCSKVGETIYQSSPCAAGYKQVIVH